MELKWTVKHHFMLTERYHTDGLKNITPDEKGLLDSPSKI